MKKFNQMKSQSIDTTKISATVKERDTRNGNKLDLKSELQGERWTRKLEQTFSLICNHKLYSTAAWDICNSKFEKYQSYYV